MILKILKFLVNLVLSLYYTTLCYNIKHINVNKGTGGERALFYLGNEFIISTKSADSEHVFI